MNWKQTFLERKSVRAYTEEPVSEEMKKDILKATLRAPTAGNQMLYSILDIRDQGLKEKLAESCDHQPFIAKAPWVLLFLADYQKLYDYFMLSGVEDYCRRNKEPLKKPKESDLILACCDALIAAQTAVAAAESLGLGSCYIGDILENCEQHRQWLELPDYVFPVTMVCFGHPTGGQRKRKQPPRMRTEHVVFENTYTRLTRENVNEVYSEHYTGKGPWLDGCSNAGQHMYKRKFSADFSDEMRRSVREWLKAWQ